MDKKYTKTKKEEKISADGIDNAEHILDLTHEIEMIYDNIMEDTNIGIDVFNFVKNELNSDEDFLDAYHIACENLIEIEKTAKVLINFVKIDGKNEEKLKEIHEKMKNLEEKSTKIVKSLLD